MEKENSNKGTEPSINSIDTSKLKSGSTLSDIGPKGAISAAFGNKDFGDSMYDEDNLPSSHILDDSYKELRGQRQGRFAKIGSGLANAVTQTGIDIIKDASYLLDYENLTDFTKSSQEGFDNWLASSLQSVEDKLKLPVYRTKASEGFSPLSAGWWGDNIPSIVSTVSMMIPAEGAVMGLSKIGKLMGGEKLIRGIEGVSGITGLDAAMKGVTGAVISRQMENLMEGGQTFQDTYQEAIKAGKNEDEAKVIAGEAAANNYKLNWANLATDIPQYLLLNKSFKQSIKDQQIKFSDLAKTMAQEGGEEAYQFTTNEETKRAALIKSGILEDDKSDVGDRLVKYSKDGDFWTSAFLGALGGGLFTGAAKIKNDRNIDKLNEQYETLAKLHTATIKGDEQSFNRTSDDVFSNELLSHIKEGTVDQFKEVLGKTVEIPEEASERAETSKKLNERNKVIDFVNNYKDKLANDNTKSSEIKALELSTVLEQKLASKRLQDINTKILRLQGEDISILQLQDPTLYQFKLAKLKYEAIKDDNIFKDEANKLAKSINESYDLILKDKQFSSKEEIDKAITSINDNELVSLIKNRELDNKRLSNSREVLYNISKEEGRKVYQDIINETKEELEKEAKKEQEEKENPIENSPREVAKKDTDKIHIVLHGDTEENENGLSRDDNSKLNQDGINEAIQNKDKLKGKINTLVSSPLDRAIQTSSIINDNQSHLIHEDLKTWDIGELKGKPEKQFDEKYWVEHPDEVIPGGESFNQFKERTINAFKHIANTSNGNTAIVTHSKVESLIKAWEAAGRKGYNIDESTYLNYKEDRSKPTILTRGDLKGNPKANIEVKTKDNIELNTKDGIVPDLGNKDRNKIEEDLKSSLSFTNEEDIEYSPQGRAITLGNLIIPAATSIAYLSKKYNEFLANIGNVTFRKLEDSEDTLNDLMQEPLLLSSKEYQIGDKLYIEVDTTFNLILPDKTSITYESLKNDPLKVPMKISNKDGKIIGYLHDIDWINPTNVVNKNNNVEEQRKLLTQFRYSIFEDGVKEVKIDNKSYGRLSTTKDGIDKPTKDLIKSNDITIAIGKDNSFWTGLEEVLNGEQPINKSIQAGLTYMIVNTPVEGKTIALPLFNTKVTDEIVNTLANAVEVFLKQDKTIADEVYKNTEHDLLTIKGLRDFFNLYVSTNNFDKADVNAATGRDDKLFLDIAGSGIKYATGGNFINEVGNLNYWDKQHFKDNLKNAYISIFLKHLDKTSFKTCKINDDGTVEPKESTYLEHIKEYTTTNIVEHKISDNEYSYFIQPVITFTDKIEAEKQIDNHEVEELINPFEGANSEEQTDAPNELGTIDLNDLQLNEDEDLLPIKLEQIQIENIASQSSLIKGFSASKQAQVIAIMNSYILKKLKESGEQNKEALYNELKSVFEKYSKYYSSAKPALGSEFKKILENFEEFKSQSQDRLKLFNVKETSIDGNIGTEDLESDNEKVNFDDGATFQLDSKDGMSSRLKQFLSFIPSPKKSYIGLDAYMPYDEVVNYLSGQLAGLDADYTDISSRLDELVSNHEWIKNVKILLDNSSEQIKNEFVQWATKHYTGFKIAEIKEGKEDNTIKIMDSDQNSITKVILAKWLTNLKTSNLVKENKPGELIIDNEVRKSLIEEINNTSKTDLEAIRKWLNKIGIDISSKTLEAIRDNKRKSIEDQFKTNGIFKTIIDNLSKEIDKDDTFESNNPLLNNSGIRQLAYLEAKHAESYYSNSFKNGEGKTIYSYSANKYFIKQFYRLKHNKKNYLSDLLKLSFNSTSEWGKKLSNPNSYFREVFDYFYLDTLKIGNNSVTLDKMSSREHEVTKLGMFQNQMNGSKERGYISHFLFPTMSDKSTMTGITATRHNTNIRFNEDGSYNIGSSTIDALYTIVEAEYNRIRNSYNIENIVDGYSPNRFYFFEELNDNELLWETKGNQKTLRPLNDDINNTIREILVNHVKSLIEEKKNHWNNLDITRDTEYKYFDKSYIFKVKEVAKNDSNIITYSAADFVINYLIANANTFQLFIGDPAQFWKKNLEETWINIGKRLAAEIAPGLELADSKNNKYRQAFAKDASGKLRISKNYEQLVKLIGKEAAEPYSDIEGTDAQEITTLAEHLYILVKSGRISQDKADELLTKENKGTLDKNDYTIIFQPIKPVYVNTQIDPSLDLNRKIYIKSSSFPLIKGLTPELDNLRSAMIKQGVDRLAFKSATKVGGPKDWDNIFDEEGNINPNVEFKNTLELSREGFRIQQDVPFDPEKAKINRGTQESKLLFANILDIKGFELNGDKLTGKELYNKYNELNRDLFENARRDLLNELINKDSGQLDLIKVQDMLKSEAIGRSWPQNDIDSLALVNLDEFTKTFKLPLWASTSANKIEALLNSLVDNRVRKNKFRGNSFVLGTEEGFKGSSKNIIFTKNYNPETGLLPQRLDKDGNVLPAQILISNKLRDENGNLINIDLDKIDPEVLKMFGFRIPTQGHSSMSYMEIVGFLPSYMGDLVIAPKDFTKQMGSDFDIDKLYTYMYETELIDDKLVKKESLQNSILDIHLSVMSHPKVLEQVLQPLGFGNLKTDRGGISKNIDKARNARLKKEFKPTRLSDTYQKQKYMNARGGKAGTGVKSLDSVFTAISQNKDIYLRTLDKDGKDIPLYIIFGDEKGNKIELNNISSKNSINGNPKIYTVAAYQSAAVDNEKEQILEKINSNNYTFDTERALAAVGYTEEFIAPLTAQDIIFEYVDLMSRTQDSLNEEFISNPENTTTLNLLDKYATLGGFSPEIYESLLDSDYPLTQKEMWDSIENGDKDPNYYKTQIRTLVKFNKARQIGKEISNIQLAINTDSSGIPSSIIESTYKQENVEKISTNEIIANAQNLLIDTINGYATDNALKVANDLWADLFPYKSNRIKEIFNEVQKVTGKKVFTSEQRMKLFNDIKSFIYTKQDLGLDNEDISKVRERLFFDTKNNKSLATRIKDLQLTSKNPFIIRLIPEPDITGFKPSLIKYNAGAGENLDELNVYQGFADLFITENTRELAQDLVTYFYLSGGIQQAIQFGKYIPVAYISNIPFASGLRNLSFDNEALFGINDFKQDYYEVSNFTKQWLQHNPSQAIKIKDDLSQLDNIKRDKSDIITSFSITNEKGKDLLSLKINPTTGEAFQGLPEFVAIHNSKSAKYFNLYQYIGNNQYKQIDTLGTFGYSEYNQNQHDITSLLKANQSNVELPIDKTKTDNRDNLELEQEIKVDNNQKAIDRFKSYNLDKNDINSTLFIIEKSSNKALAELAKYLNTIEKQSSITFESTREKIRASYKDSIIKINTKQITSDEEFERVILHEYIHHLTRHTIHNPNKTKDQQKVVDSLKRLQDILIKKINSNSKTKAEYEEFLSSFRNKKGIDESQLSKYYGAIDTKLTEFVTMAMTDLEFQKILNDIPFNESKSILDRFIDIVRNLLSSLGFPIKENSVLEHAIHDSIELINLNNSEYTKQVSEDRLPAKEYSKEIILNQLKEKGIIGQKPFAGYYWVFKNREQIGEDSQYRSNLRKLKYIIDTEKQLYGISSISLIETSNGTKLLFNDNNIKKISEIASEDLSPKIIKYQSEIDKIKDRINFIKKRIAANKSNRELVSELNAKVKTLQDRIEQIESEDKLADIISYGNSDMKELEKLLSKDKISNSDLFYSNKIIHQWENSLSALFKEGDLKQVDGEYSPNVQAIQNIITQAQVFRNRYTNVFNNAFLELIKSKDIKATPEEIFAAKKEIGILQANLMDISRTADPLVQAVDKIIRDAAFDTEQELIEEYKKTDELAEKAMKTPLFKSKGFKIFAQESKDGKTGNLVSRFSEDFYKESKKLRKKAKELGPKGWGAYFRWKRENTIVFDLRKLFYEDYQSIDGKTKYSDKDIKTHIEDLKTQLGEKGYNEYYNRLKAKLELYKEDLQANKDRIESLEADDSEKVSLLEEWLVENSPFIYAEHVYDNIKSKVGDKYITPKGYKYTAEVPRRYTQGLKKTNWYDEKFEQIEANEDLYNFYNHILTTYNELYEYMPDYIVDELQYNYLPEIRKNIVELFSDKGMTKGLEGWYDKVVNELTTDDLSNTSYAERDPITGKLVKSLPISMLGNRLSAEEKSYDLLKVTKAFTAMAISYKHKSKVEDSIRLAEQAMSNALEKQENAQGEHLIDSLGRPINTKDSLKNLKSQFEYAVEAGFYGKRKNIEGISKKKLLTIEEKKQEKKLKALLKDPKTKEEDKAAIQQEIDSIGSNIVGSSVWDKLLQFVQLKGMGWNLFAPSNNVVFAFVSNAIHASGGEDFNINDFFWAQRTMLNSVGKSVSLDTIKTKTANKINALMELYNVVGEIDQAAYKSTSLNSGAVKGLHKLSPLELTRRAEFLNQGTTFLALMKATKVEDITGKTRNLWEAYDEKGQWRETEFGPHPKWTKSKESMKAFKYKLEQIKKTIHGNYDPNSPVKIKKTVLGRALVMFRSWVAEGFAARFETQKYDELLGRDRKGRLRTWNPLTGGDIGYISGAGLLLSQMANFLTFGTTFNTSLDKLSLVDKANMRKNAAEVLIYLSLYMLVLALKHADSDDDKEKKAINALLNVGFRVQNDMAFFTSPLAFEKITQSSIPAMTVITDAAKLVKAMEDQIIGKGTYTRGTFKGQNKVKIALAKQAPGAVQIVRTIQGLSQEPTQ